MNSTVSPLNHIPRYPPIRSILNDHRFNGANDSSQGIHMGSYITLFFIIFTFNSNVDTTFGSTDRLIANFQVSQLNNQ